MSSQKNPTSLSEAIAKLENAGNSKAQDMKEILEKDYNELKKAVESLQPHLEEIKIRVESEAKAAKNKVETQVKENPWIALGIVGLFGLIIGFILGFRRRD